MLLPTYHDHVFPILNVILIDEWTFVHMYDNKKRPQHRWEFPAKIWVEAIWISFSCRQIKGKRQERLTRLQINIHDQKRGYTNDMHRAPPRRKSLMCFSSN